MECFNHDAIQAVGLCRSCNKAVCKSCALVFPKGMACSEACEKDAKELIETNERSKKIYGIGDYKTNKLASGVLVWILLSVVMWIAFSVSYFLGDSLDISSLAMAIIFSVITVIAYRSSKNTGINC
jgi:hypothetical protein